MEEVLKIRKMGEMDEKIREMDEKIREMGEKYVQWMKKRELDGKVEKYVKWMKNTKIRKVDENT